MVAIYHDFTGGVPPNPGGQTDFINDWTSFIVGLEGGWGSGKTWGGARKLLHLHLENAVDAKGNLTFVPSAVIAPTYSNAMDFDVPALEDAMDEAGVKWIFRSSGSAASGKFAGPVLVLPEYGDAHHPSCILVRSAEAPERITGWEVGAAWADEPARWTCGPFNPLKNAWLQLKGRVRHLKAALRQILATYTNEGDNTIIYKEMHSGLPDRALYRAASSENPTGKYLYDQHINSLTPDLVKQYLMGEAASFRGGKVYSEFDPNKNVDDSVELVEGVPLHISIDFNISPGMHGLIGQYHEHLDMFTCVHEIHGRSMTVRKMIERLAEMIGEGKELGKWRWPILEVYGDATGRNRWAATGQNQWQIVRDALDETGIPYRMKVPPDNGFIADRVNAFNVALYDFGQEVHYRCHSRCERLIEDLRDMSWNEFGEIDTKQRKLGHPSDAEGYRVNYLRPCRIRKVRTMGGRVSA